MHYTINTINQLKPILKGFRKAQGLSQKAMADKLGITQQTYQALEANPHRVTVDRLLRVLSIMGVKLILSESKPINDSTKRQVLRKDGSMANRAKKKETW